MTVTSFYPDAHPESTSVDGTVYRQEPQPSGAAWSSIRSGAGEFATDSGVTYTTGILSADDTGSGWEIIYRAAMLFDTSALGATATISSATWQFVSTSKTNNLTDAQSVRVVSVDPSSNTGLVTGDYAVANWGTTGYTADFTIAGVTSDSSTYNSYALNSDGLAAIEKTGITKFGIRIVSEVTNSEPAHSGLTNKYARVVFASAEENLSGDKRPKLVVTYTVPFVPKVIMF
jgi:hypothetical protein